MNSLDEIVTLIESRAIELYGSVNKMLIDNSINSSVLPNMKRSKPSIPNIFTFCKLAEAVNLSIDHLLMGKETNNKAIIDAKERIKDRLSADERSLLNTYKDMDDDGKTLMLNTAKEIWADHRLPKGKLSNSKENELIG